MAAFRVDGRASPRRCAGAARNCAGLVAEADKPRMVREGRWRVLRAGGDNITGAIA